MKKEKTVSRFKAIASRSLSASVLMENREKVDTSDVVGKNLTIEDFDIVEYVDGEGKNVHYAVVIFAEMPDKYYQGGYVLTRMIDDIVEDFDEGLEFARDAYADTTDAEKIQIRLEESKTKGGKNLTKVEVI